LLGRKLDVAELGDDSSDVCERCEVMDGLEDSEGRACGGKFVWIGICVVGGGKEEWGDASVGEASDAWEGGCAGKVPGIAPDDVVDEAPGEIGDIEAEIGDELYGCSIGC
jgi:hypothetical protein